jgi:hypothetical protein
VHLKSGRMPVDRPEKRMKITNGESVILVLHTPREKLLGLLDEINQSGVFVRAIDLEYFDDWCRSIVNEEPYLPMRGRPRWPTYLNSAPAGRLESFKKGAGKSGCDPSVAKGFREDT